MLSYDFGCLASAQKVRGHDRHLKIWKDTSQGSTNLTSLSLSLVREVRVIPATHELIDVMLCFSVNYHCDSPHAVSSSSSA
jgi:hypothetical protein